MHTTHHHVPPSHSKPLAKLLTIAAVVLFAAGGYSSSVLSGLQRFQPVYVAQVPENFPASVAKVCDANCVSEPDGKYKFCRNECVATGKSQPVGCDASGYKIGSPATDHECDNYATCEGSGFSCVASKSACTSAGGTENTTWKCADSAKTCCQPKADDPAKRQVTCNDSCVSGTKGEKNSCYRECHQNKVGYKHDVSCKNDGSGGVQWVLENEVADTDCGAAGGPTATPQPGGGPTSTPVPGTGKVCTGNGFQCVATGRECEDQLGGTAESGRSGCSSDQVCCNLNTKPRCAGDGYTCEAGGNECNAAGGKVINTRVCDRPNLKCCDFQTSCQRSGNQCMDTATCTQLQGTATGDTSCGNTMICCKQRQIDPTRTPTPKPGTAKAENDCEEAGWTCIDPYTLCSNGKTSDKCPTSNLPVCCKIPNEKNIKNPDCKDKTGEYKIGGICYKCHGYAKGVYPGPYATQYEWGEVITCKESATTVCQKSAEKYPNKECLIKTQGKCYSCNGYKDGESWGDVVTCQNNLDLKEGACYLKQDMCQLVKKTCEEFPLSLVCKASVAALKFFGGCSLSQ